MARYPMYLVSERTLPSGTVERQRRPIAAVERTLAKRGKTLGTATRSELSAAMQSRP